MSRHGGRGGHVPANFPIEPPGPLRAQHPRVPSLSASRRRPRYMAASHRRRLKTCTGADVAPPSLTSEALPARRHCCRNAKAVEGHPAAFMQFKCALADDRKSRLEFEASLHSNGTGVYEREGSPRLPLHLSCVTRLTHGIACFKQVQLNLRGQIVSVHDYYRVDATQHMLLLLSQGGVRLAVALRLRPWNSTRAFPSGGENPFSLNSRMAKTMQVPSETEPALWGAAGGPVALAIVGPGAAG